jgi:hypothetical protein
MQMNSIIKILDNFHIVLWYNSIMEYIILKKVLQDSILKLRVSDKFKHNHSSVLWLEKTIISVITKSVNSERNLQFQQHKSN